MLYKEIRRVSRDGGVLNFDDDEQQKAQTQGSTEAQGEEVSQKVMERWHRI